MANGVVIPPTGDENVKTFNIGTLSTTSTATGLDISSFGVDDMVLVGITLETSAATYPLGCDARCTSVYRSKSVPIITIVMSNMDFGGATVYGHFIKA